MRVLDLLMHMDLLQVCDSTGRIEDLYGMECTPVDILSFFYCSWSFVCCFCRKIVFHLLIQRYFWMSIVQKENAVWYFDIKKQTVLHSVIRHKKSSWKVKKINHVTLKLYKIELFIRFSAVLWPFYLVFLLILLLLILKHWSNPPKKNTLN